MVDSGIDTLNRIRPRDLAASDILNLIRSGEEFSYSDIRKIVGNYFPRRLATGSAFDYMLQRIVEENVQRQLGKEEKQISTKLRKCMVIYQHTHVRKSRHDELTNLFRRSYFIDRLQERLEKNPRQTIVMLDLDHFKDVNDNLGHSAGDNVLKDFAYMFDEVFNGQGLYGRYGGEEFILAFPVSEDYDLKQRLNLLTEKFSGYYQVNYKNIAGRFKGTLSMGIFSADFNQPEMDIKTAIGRADDALYKAKEKRNTRIFWSQDIKLKPI